MIDQVAAGRPRRAPSRSTARRRCQRGRRAPGPTPRRRALPGREGMTHHDLIVIGTGSGNRVIDDSFADLDVAIVEQEQRFGGTCLNVGCIPTKMLAYTGEVVDTVTDAGRFGVARRLDGMRWRAVRDRVFDRLDPIARDGRAGRRDRPGSPSTPDTRGSPARARCRSTGRTVDPDRRPHRRRRRQPAGRAAARSRIRACRTRPRTRSCAATRRRTAGRARRRLYRRRARPRLRGRGRDIVMVEQADRCSAAQDETVTEEFTELAAKRFDLRLGREATQVVGRAGRTADHARRRHDRRSRHPARRRRTGAQRRPAGPGRGGHRRRRRGRIVVDAHQRTTADGVWALGDVCTPVPLKHVANRRGRRRRPQPAPPRRPGRAGHDTRPVGVFTHPQIAAIGATEQDLRDRGVDYRGAGPYGDIAYGWAMEDKTGFCKVLVDPADGRPGRAHHGPPGPHPHPAARARGHARHRRPHAGRPAVLDPPRPHRGRAAGTYRSHIMTSRTNNSGLGMAQTGMVAPTGFEPALPP